MSTCYAGQPYRRLPTSLYPHTQHQTTQRLHFDVVDQEGEDKVDDDDDDDDDDDTTDLL